MEGVISNITLKTKTTYFLFSQHLLSGVMKFLAKM